MEGAEVELLAELVFGIFAKLENFHLARSCSQEPERPSIVAVGFGLDTDFVFAGVLVKKIDELAGASSVCSECRYPRRDETALSMSADRRP